jgi:nucleoporin POM152
MLISYANFILDSSGDTGVSVSLILQGKPPFKVFYQTKRDGKSTRELSKVFHGSRAEITLQPERFDAFHNKPLLSY